MTFTGQDIRFALDLVKEKLEAAARLRVDASAATDGCLRVDLEGTDARVAAPDRNALFRGVFLAAAALSRGEGLHTAQTRHFKDCGPMLDMSRGAVMTVESVKEYMNDMAMLGLNYMQLYLEDLYPVPGYPYFGYLRGRYSADELKEMDAYARRLGIELVPNIQTLGHLGQFLQWGANASLADQPTVLMIDHEETYAFIEAEIRACAELFSSRHINIGMDEANGVGLGRYYKLHGDTDRFALMCRHLERVTGICRKYGLEPMMWSDMFFRLGSETGRYYDVKSHVPDDVIARVPDVRLGYWDYYNRDSELIAHMFKEHARIRPDTVFAGGVWTWCGFLPQTERTYATSAASLPQCLSNHVSTVIATLWGDDGAETDLLTAVQLLPIFSETCWLGQVPDREGAVRVGALLTGIPAEAWEAFSCFYSGWEDDRSGKGFIYCDPLYPLVKDARPAECAKRFREGERRLEAYRDVDVCEYARCLFRLAAHKAELAAELRERYLRGDRAFLERTARQTLPQLSEETDALRNAHRALWKKHNKPYGWEVLVSRYGACMARLEDVGTEIEEYLSGERGSVAALDEEPLPPVRTWDQFYTGLAFPGAGPL